MEKLSPLRWNKRFKKKEIAVKRLIIIFFIGLAALASWVPRVQGKSYGNIPLYFIPNKGQVNSQAKFYARTGAGIMWLTEKGLTFDHGGSQLVFLNAREKIQVMPADRSSHRVNIIKGRDPSRWRTGIPTSRAVLYKQVYRHIDFKIYGIEKQVEYDWIVKPGGSPGDITFKYPGAANVRIDKQGNLRVQTADGELVHRKPRGYQVINGHKRNVEVVFRRVRPNIYGFRAAAYDKSHELIIDPVILAYSTYLGGSASEYGAAIAVDHTGCAYVTGSTSSLDFPVADPLQETLVADPWGYGRDVFISKLSPTGDSLVYSTYLGGSGGDLALGIAVDDNGSAYISGNTYSTDFPVENAFQPNLALVPWGYGLDIFIAKLSPDGGSLVYSTYLGGTQWENCGGLAIDSSGSAYVTGYTDSTDFPVKNPFQENLLIDQWGYGQDAYITKLSPDGGSLVYSTYLGGTQWESGESIAVDSSGSAYITGYTDSMDFPLENPFLGNLNMDDWGYGVDIFVTKLSPGGDALVYSTYLGGNNWETSGDIAVDSAGSAYVTGLTTSSDFPMENPFQGSLRLDRWGYGQDAFITKFSPEGGALVYSTYLGGSDMDEGVAAVVNDGGSAFVCGTTSSMNFPTEKPFQELLQLDSWGYGVDLFITKLSPSGDMLAYSTYLGGTGMDSSHDIALDTYGNAYVTGMTGSADFPIENPFMEYNHDEMNDDGFVLKIPNLLLTLDISRGMERTWLIKKYYAEIRFTIDNDGSIPVSGYIIYRKENGGSYQVFKEIPGSQIQPGVYTYYDIITGPDAAHTYKAEALDADGNVIAVSYEHTI
jgi:hypothetical protein